MNVYLDIEDFEHRIAELEESVNNKLLPYISDDDERDDSQQATLARHARILSDFGKRLDDLENVIVDEKISKAVNELRDAVEHAFDVVVDRMDTADGEMAKRIGELEKSAADSAENIESLSTDLTKVMTETIPALREKDSALDERITTYSRIVSDNRNLIITLQQQHVEDAAAIRELRSSLSSATDSIAAISSELALVRSIVDTDKGYTLHELIDMIQENARQLVKQSNMDDVQNGKLDAIDERVTQLEGAING